LGRGEKTFTFGLNLVFSTPKKLQTIFLLFLHQLLTFHTNAFWAVGKTNTKMKKIVFVALIGLLFSVATYAQHSKSATV
jgi:hypothetical protein